jgi:hypothetical protein
MNKNIALLYGLCLLGLCIACQKSFSSGKSLPQSSAGSMEVRKSDEEEIKRMIVAGEKFSLRASANSLNRTSHPMSSRLRAVS